MLRSIEYYYRMPAKSDRHLSELHRTAAVESLERRRRTRVSVHWPLRFFRSDAPIETVTHDLSSDGFYFLTRDDFAPGEALSCMLGVPTHHPNGADRMAFVDCRIRIVRVEPAAEEGLYGIGCRIEEYRLIPGAA